MATGYYSLSGVTVAGGGTTLVATQTAAPGGSPAGSNFLNLVGPDGSDGTPSGALILGPAGQIGIVKHAINATTLQLSKAWVGAAITGGTAEIILGINTLPIGRLATAIMQIITQAPLLKTNNLGEFAGDTTAQAAIAGNLGLDLIALLVDRVQSLNSTKQTQGRRNLGITAAGDGVATAASIAAARAALQITAAGEALALATDTKTQRLAMGVAAQVSAKTGAYSVVAGDYGKVFAASGTWTFGLLAAATAGTDFCVEIRNTGTGRITIDPNGSELVNGATTLTLYRGEAAKLVCDGTSWHALYLSSFAIIDAAYPIGAAVATIDLLLPAEFRSFDLRLESFNPAASAATGLRFSQDNGATFLTAGYGWAQAYSSSSTTYATSYSSGASGGIFANSAIEISAGITSLPSGSACEGNISIFPGGSGRSASAKVEFAATTYSSFGSGWQTTAGRITNARLLMSTGNIDAASCFELIGRR